MKLVYYTLGSLITLSILSASIKPVQAMFADEVATIGYNPATTTKKRFPALDKGLGPVATTNKLTTIKATTSIAKPRPIAAKTTTDTSRIITSAATITVDVRQAATEQQSRIQSVQRVKTPQVALIDTNTLSSDITTSSITKFPALDQAPIETSETTNTASDNPDIVYLNDRQYVDEMQVRDAWLVWTNELRDELGRAPYTTDRRLNATARSRSEGAARIGSISHRRRSGDSYYNYNRIVQWFKDTGNELVGQPLVFRNVSRATFSESIGRGMYSCKVADCTQNMIDATRSTWRFFYGERSYNGVHYRALTHPRFALQGVGLGYTSNKYYLTIHYGTEILED